MSDEDLRLAQQAVKDERTRVMSGLIKLRNHMDGLAKEASAGELTAFQAFEEAANLVAKFINEELGGHS